MIKEEIYLKAKEMFTTQKQMIVAMEECAELIKEISKMLRGKGNVEHLAEEIADVDIMLEQLMLMFNCSGICNTFKSLKLERLEKLIRDRE